MVNIMIKIMAPYVVIIVKVDCLIRHFQDCGEGGAPGRNHLSNQQAAHIVTHYCPGLLIVVFFHCLHLFGFSPLCFFKQAAHIVTHHCPGYFKYNIIVFPWSMYLTEAPSIWALPKQRVHCHHLNVC